MRKKTEKLWPCPIARSSRNDAYNDICSATGKPCPYFVDEGMSVCKSKRKCLSYFAKRGSGVKLSKVIKLIFSNTKPRKGEKSQYTNTIKRDKRTHATHMQEANEANDLFVEGLEEALKNRK